MTNPNGGEAELEALLRERWPPPAWIHPAYPRALLEEDESRRTAIRAARARRAEALAANGWQETEETRLDGAIARWLAAWEAVHGFAPLPRHWPGIEAPIR